MIEMPINIINRVVQPLWSALLLVALTACSTVSPVEMAQSYIAEEEWLQAVMEYRAAYNADRNNIELKSRLQQTELRAADFYYQHGQQLLDQGNLDAAIGFFQQGLVAKPDHAKVQQAMAEALGRRESEQLLIDAYRALEQGRRADARALADRALVAYPNNERAAAFLEQLAAVEESAKPEGLSLMSEELISLNFRRTELKTAFEFIADSFGINVIFDDAVKSTPVVLYAENVTFYQALNLLLATSKTFYKEIGQNTILVAPDTDEKRGQYEEHLIRVFHLKDVKATEMIALIKGVIQVEKVVVNEQLNTITVRDSREVIDLVERLVLLNDRRPAEMILDVELLEVDHQKASQIGLDFGQQMTLTFPRWPVSDSLRTILRQGTVTLPAITFRYFKQDVDAQVLSNPKIRVMNGRSATIHIGDRVPLRSATIQDATGQTRTTFEYRDIGIKLIAVPEIHLDNSVTVKLSLEVSSLGSNVGTQEEPAFSIGTRNADTYMLLRDGETAILGGLISEGDRSSRIRVPGVGDIPAVGALFTSYDDSSKRTDVLLTITPRVVRAWELPSEPEREFYSGTQKSYASQPLFAFLDDTSPTDSRPTIKFDSGSQEGAVAAVPLAPNATPVPLSSEPGTFVARSTDGVGLQLGFEQPLYVVDTTGTTEVNVLVESAPETESFSTEILFNPSIVTYRGASRGRVGSDVEIDDSQAEKGVIKIRAMGIETVPAGEPAQLAKLTFVGAAPGISYLVYRAVEAVLPGGDTAPTQTGASRVNVR